MARAVQNPFGVIYKECNTGTMADKAKRIKPFPDYLDVELTNNCQLSCKMCPTGLNISSRPKHFLPAHLMQKIIQECIIYPNCRGIRFVRWGESLLHPSCVEFIHLVKKAGLLCHLNTNGVLADNEFISDILKAKLDSIKISYHTSVYSSKDAHTDVTKRIRELYLKRSKRQYPFILVGTTIDEVKDDPEFKDKVKPICDKVIVSKTKNLLNPNVITNYPECPEAFNKLSINSDGSVTACCADWDGLLIVGNLNKQSLKEIWDSKELNQIREMLVKHQHNLLPVCKQCIL